ncbi:hypothetical protein OBBRIDRAFT_793397 [Obba rivulosa]|uniref:DUF6533 domain-containing protein n=1 Tax=Obba rivulosa TaxID=1052685 RepID=A0A8E2AWD8_9APHY|nr:hypothetical protein OBBRIDRAFT_793397 [Obba rivulosa]
MHSAEFVEELTQLIIVEYCDIATCVIVFYDFIATFSAEVEVIWRPKLSDATSILFLLNRYCTLLDGLSTIVPLPATDLVCKFESAIDLVSQLIFFAVSASFCTLRTYGLTNRGLVLAGLALSLGLVPFGTNLYYQIPQILSTFAIDGQCISSWIPSARTSDILAVVTRVGAIISDTIVLYATISNAESLKTAARSNQRFASLSRLLLRDGSFYFGSLVVLNCMQLAFLVSNKFPYLGYFTTPLSSIIISHFILDLRETYVLTTRQTFLHEETSEFSVLSTIHLISIEIERPMSPQSLSSPLL